jgi:hypothetical protein
MPPIVLIAFQARDDSRKPIRRKVYSHSPEVSSMKKPALHLNGASSKEIAEELNQFTMTGVLVVVLPIE